MARRKTMNQGLYSFDAGNGTVQGITSDVSEVIEFSPLIAPITSKRALNEEDAAPRFSLGLDDTVYVFGVEDVFDHGRRDSRRRLNSLERVNNADYFMLIDVLFLAGFTSYLGNYDYLAPTGVIALPISLYNDRELVEDVKDTLIGRGKREIVGYDNCALTLKMKPENITILPESAGAMFHYAFSPDTLRRRTSAALAGSTLVIDVGYQTTDVSLFEGMKYIPDAGFTVDRAGMGLIARDIEAAVQKQVRGADASRIDRGMRVIAGSLPGKAKKVEVAPNQYAEVGEVYDARVNELSTTIAQAIQTQFGGSVNRAVIAGGGAYHLARSLDDMLPFETMIVSEADRANVIGAYTGLQIKLQS